MILITGGAGYIGSHTCVALANAGYKVLILDNLCNSYIHVLDRLGRISGARPDFIQGDIRDRALLEQLFIQYPVKAVIHFAALKVVGESLAEPCRYYDNNVAGMMNLLAAMQSANVKHFVFSSSAAVYGTPLSVPIDENAQCSPTSPYGRTKQIGENILSDLHFSDPSWSICRLRYFNPAGAHESGLIGEDPRGVPNNLIPFLTQVANGQRDLLLVYGGDYPTFDGTGIRDYVHVMDIADGHVAALRYLFDSGGLATFNLGSGKGYSVLQVVTAFEAVSRRPIQYEIVPRRPGDVAECWADPTRAEKVLGWRALRGLDQICADSWRWQQQAVKGFKC